MIKKPLVPIFPEADQRPLQDKIYKFAKRYELLQADKIFSGTHADAE